MSISIKSNADGVSGAIQVNGVDVVTIGASGITSGTPAPQVTLSGSETLTNKTISASTNTINGVAASSFVVSNASGRIDATAPQKIIPTGDVLGTTDSQALSNKTISTSANIINGVAASSFVVSNSTGRIDASAAQKIIPTGDVLGTTDSQTLTNKTLVTPILSNPTVNDGYTEEIYNVTTSGNISLTLTNGSIQLFTLNGNIIFTDAISSGQSMLIGITPGANSTTWPSITWIKVGGSGTAPTLTSTGVNWIVLWKVGSTLRGAFLGTA